MCNHNLKNMMKALTMLLFVACCNTALGGIYIVCNDDGSNPVVTKEHVVSVFADANKVLAQGGIHFPVTTNEVQYINRSTWKILRYNSPSFGRILRDMGAVPKHGALRIFFVDTIDGSNRVGFNGRRCLVVAKNATGMVLAHEIGHACGLRDIYATQDGLSIADAGVVKAAYLDPLDWGAGYYADDLQQTNLITRLLMYGYIHPNMGHIPHGRVYGVYKPRDAAGNLLPTTRGMAPVGLKDFNRNPQHED